MFLVTYLFYFFFTWNAAALCWLLPFNYQGKFSLEKKIVTSVYHLLVRENTKLLHFVKVGYCRVIFTCGIYIFFFRLFFDATASFQRGQIQTFEPWQLKRHVVDLKASVKLGRDVYIDRHMVKLNVGWVPFIAAELYHWANRHKSRN